MDLRLSPQHLKFRDELRAWLAANLSRPWREEVRDPQATEDSLVELRRRWQQKLYDAGHLGMDWPAAWGGRGATGLAMSYRCGRDLEPHHGSTEAQLERALAAAGF